MSYALQRFVAQNPSPVEVLSGVCLVVLGTVILWNGETMFFWRDLYDVLEIAVPSHKFWSFSPMALGFVQIVAVKRKCSFTLALVDALSAGFLMFAAWSFVFNLWPYVTPAAPLCLVLATYNCWAFVIRRVWGV